MKKGKENRQTRKPVQQFFKYVQPGQLSQGHSASSATKIHTRSMIQLEPNQPNQRYLPSARIPQGKENHYVSVSTNREGQQTETVKSNSLKKFLSLFGDSLPSNPISNFSNANIKSNRGEGERSRPGPKQIYTCNIKNANVSGSKEKEGRPILILKREKANNNQYRNESIYRQSVQSGQKQETRWRKIAQETRQRQLILHERVSKFQIQNRNLRQQIRGFNGEKAKIQERFRIRESELLRKQEQYENQPRRDRCKQHDLIIQSLKKVINEQLRKIIELQKNKIQRQQIEKLQECINQNIGMNTMDIISKEKLKFFETNPLLSKVRRKQAQIKIEEKSSPESEISSKNKDCRTYGQSIEEAAEEQELNDSSEMIEGEGDSILEEVDKYLAHWRSKS